MHHENRVFAALVLAGVLALLAACNSSGDGGGAGPTITGVASAPGGVLAKTETGGMSAWFARLWQPTAWAQAVSGLTPLPNANVFLIRVDSTGTPVATLAQTTTNGAGTYTLPLGGTSLASDLVVQVTMAAAPQTVGTTGTLSAPAVQSAMNIHPATELVLRRAVGFATNTGAPSLTVFSPAALRELVRVAESAMIADPAPNGSTIDEWVTHVSTTIGSDLGNAVTRLGTGVGGLFFFTTTLPDGIVGVNFGPAGGYPILAISIPPGPLTYSVISGQFPDGLTLGSNTGKIAGAPTVANSFTFTIRVGSATLISSRSFTVTVTGTAPPAAAGSLAAGDTFSIARLSNGNLMSWGDDAAGYLGAGNGDQTRDTPGNVLTSNITSVASGAAHSLAVRGTGEVAGWGYNGFGQLGLGDNSTRESPAILGWDEGPIFQTNIDAVAVCGGVLHSLILRSSGEVRAMGYNLDGQLGDGTNTDRDRGVVVSGIDGVGNQKATAVSCGGSHSLALMQDGTVRTWGLNDNGQLGDNSTTKSNAPVTVGGLSNVVDIAGGFDFSMALKNDGTVWAWGSNDSGKLGDGTETESHQPVQVAFPVSFAGPATAIAAGGQFSMALDSSGVVFTWGSNEVGQLGSGSLTPGFRTDPAQVPAFCPNGGKAVEIEAGTNGGLEHVLARCEDGTVWAWGYNNHGQTGTGSPNAILSSPVQISGLNLN